MKVEHRMGTRIYTDYHGSKSNHMKLFEVNLDGLHLG